MKFNLKTAPKMNMDLVAFVLTAFALITSMFSCAPAIEEKKNSMPFIASGPHFHDKNLLTNENKSFADKSFTTEKIDFTLNQTQRLEYIENQFTIAQQKNSSFWKEKAKNSFLEFKKTEKFLDLKLEDSVYLDIVDSQIAETVSAGVNTADLQLQKDVELVSATVREQQKENLLITLESPLAEKLNQTASFIDKVVAKIDTLEIMPEFKTLFIAQMKTKSADLIFRAKNLDIQLRQAKDLEQAIKQIDTYVIESKTILSPEDQKDLADGRKLGQMVSAITNEQRGLAAVAMVWKILEPQQRDQMIKPENAELYNFLAGKGERDINCLAERNCESLVTKVILNVGVYPAIQKYGILNLKNTLNQKSRDFVLAKVNQVAFDSLTALGETIVTEVTATVQAKRTDLKNFDKNLNQVLKTNFSNYMTAHSITGMQSYLLDESNTKSNLTVQTLLIRNKLNSVDESVETNTLTKNQFEILELTLRLPEFSKALDNNQAANTVITKPELVNLLIEPKPRQYLKDGKSSEVINLQDQTDALITTAKIIRDLADWKISSFDENLSAIQAKEIITEFTTAELDKSFFSKADLLALALSVSSETLKLLEDEKSPLVLIDNDQKIVLIKDFDEESSAIALAAATDFKLEIRSSVIKAQDLSRFQMALIDFYTATTGLEKSASAVLRKETPGKISLMNQVLAARKKIKTLVVAIGNFLSNQMMQKNGLVVSEFLLSPDQRISKSVQADLPSFDLLTQTAAVEALVRTYEMTDIDVYLWSAQDIYYSMNQQLFEPKLKFYKMNSNDSNFMQSKISVVDLTNIYKNLLSLKSYLSGDSQDQLENVFQGWLVNL